MPIWVKMPVLGAVRLMVGMVPLQEETPPSLPCTVHPGWLEAGARGCDPNVRWLRFIQLVKLNTCRMKKHQREAGTDPSPFSWSPLEDAE